jgi:tetratricopeptide (TPR) repeat protein
VRKETIALTDSTSVERIRRELGKVRASDSSMQEGPPSLFMQERDKLFGQIEELDFDYQAGRLSEEDYRDLSRDYAAQADTILKKLEVTPPPPPKTDPTREQGGKEKRLQESNGGRSPKTWVFAATTTFLLIFGVTLSIMLRESVRPRGTDNDSITGGFLTGTGGKEIQPLLTEGRASFQQQDWPKAIEAFKKALAIDPGHPEAHAYLGMILVKAGHPEGALLAFNQALARDPNFPLALWWKGMALYHDKEDLPAAREILEKLAGLLPLGQDKDRIEEILGKIRQRQGGPDQGKTVTTVSNRIEGKISIAPGLQSKADKNSILFIILRSASAKTGPPMAVKRISGATFPLAYSLGPENQMVQGKPFQGKVKITARLEKDGNAMTREPGSLLGRYEGNPVEIGSKNIDFTLDQES